MSSNQKHHVIISKKMYISSLREAFTLPVICHTEAFRSHSFLMRVVGMSERDRWRCDKLS